MFFDEQVGFILVSRVYFGVTNLTLWGIKGLPLHLINKIKYLTNYPLSVQKNQPIQLLGAILCLFYKN